jgi:hypothetical protein
MDNALNVEVISQWLWFIVQMARIAAWPLVVGLLAWWNRASILRLLESLARRALRLKGPGGFEASFDAISEQGSEAGANKYESPITPTPTLSVAAVPARTTDAPTPALGTPPPREAVAHLIGELKGKIAHADLNQQNELLLRDLAETRVRAGHEWIYNRIFGSQLLAFKDLDLRGTATVAEAQQYYDSLIPRFPDMYPRYSFDSWLRFMTNAGIVSRDGETLRPTVYGHDFIVYLAENRLSDAKPF